MYLVSTHGFSFLWWSAGWCCGFILYIWRCSWEMMWDDVLTVSIIIQCFSHQQIFFMNFTRTKSCNAHTHVCMYYRLRMIIIVLRYRIVISRVFSSGFNEMQQTSLLVWFLWKPPDQIRPDLSFCFSICVFETLRSKFVFLCCSHEKHKAHAGFTQTKDLHNRPSDRVCVCVCACVCVCWRSMVQNVS